MTLVMGSCRYHHLFGEEHTFPPRVHSTKEILNVLEQYDDITGYLRGFPSTMHSIIFGDINHPCVCRQSQQYLRNISAGKQKVHTVILEISSKKYMLYKNETVCNAFYFTDHKIPNIDNEYTLCVQSFTEIRDDIVKINGLLNERFGNPAVKLVIIPHVNLHSTKTNAHIPERMELCENLRTICGELDIIFASMSDCIPSNVTLEQVLPDGYHFGDHRYKNALKGYVMRKLSNIKILK
jgi:hypothetical protein